MSTTETVSVVAEPVPAETLAGTHSILDREAVEQTGARDMAELLRLVGVAQFSQAGSKGAMSALSLRGAKPNFTLVLLNGVPMNDIGDLLGGAFNFATIATEDVGRVDLLRGPLSSIYGSEAVGGVVAITLRPPKEQLAGHLSAESGNYSYVEGHAGGSAMLGKAAIAASGGFARMGQEVLDDGFWRGSALVQSDWDLANNKRLSSFLRWNRLRSTGFPISSGGPVYALSRTVETDRADQVAGGTNFAQQVRSHWFYTVGYDLFSRLAFTSAPAIYDSIPPGRSYVPSSVSNSRFLRQRVITVQRVQPARWLALDGVAAFRQESGVSHGTLGAALPASYTESRPTGFFSANASATGPHVSITAGAGVERSNVYRTVFSPRAGMSYRLAQTRLRASWGEGFKLPSFYALGNPLVGNAKLTPEFSRVSTPVWSIALPVRICAWS